MTVVDDRDTPHTGTHSCAATLQAASDRYRSAYENAPVFTLQGIFKYIITTVESPTPSGTGIGTAEL